MIGAPGCRSALAGGLIGLALGGPVAAGGDAGQSQYDGACAACHGPAGVGVPGFAPPLARPSFWQGLSDEAPDYLAGVILSGLVGRIEAAGTVYVGVQMPSQRSLDDETIVAIARYVLEGLNGVDMAVTPEVIQALRAAPKSHADLIAMRPMTE